MTQARLAMVCPIFREKQESPELRIVSSMKKRTTGFPARGQSPPRSNTTYATVVEKKANFT